MTTSGTTSDNELQRMATTENKQQRVTANDNERQQMTAVVQRMKTTQFQRMDGCHKTQKQIHYFKGWMAAITVVK